MKASDETVDVEFFGLEEIGTMDVGEFVRQRITDGFNFEGSSFVQDDIRI